ncbi:hypothetical protein Bca52824_083203 [Brassica carinata]|uniref:Uncharacterized protein n=1 Tax=Brassica carinata TaxID=52824 RepID=A0A8X7TSV4_BRACI|nr:hypothetical protein Bca52824_083203 [Brassica carinata]
MATTAETPLLEEHVMDAVDHDGLVADRSNTGRWTAAWFIIGVEVAERFAYYGIASNLISYLTGPLGQSTAVAAANVNAWTGISSLLPVLGAFVADAFLGRYRTIIIASLIYLCFPVDLLVVVEMAERFAFFGISSNLITYLTGPMGESTAVAAANVNAWIGTISFLPLLWAFVADAFLGRFRTIIISSSLYILGLGLLSFSAMVWSHSPNQLHVTLFFVSLYLIAIGQGGYKPCIKVFGADQFDENDVNESKAKSSYFNWLMFGNCVSISTTLFISTYIQEKVSWSLGFGIQCVAMLLALFLFLLGTKTYRFSTTRGGKNNPFARIGRVFMEAVKNRRQDHLSLGNTSESLPLLPHQSFEQFR